MASFDTLMMYDPNLDILDEGNEGRNPDTPLNLAVGLGRRDMVKNLWDAGAGHGCYAAEVRAYSRKTLIEHVAYGGYADILRDLLTWSDEWPQLRREYALWYTCRQWHDDAVCVLLELCVFSVQELERGLDFAADNSSGWKQGSRRSTQERLLTAEEDSKHQARILEAILDARKRVLGANGQMSELALLNHWLHANAFSPFNISTLRFLLERGADPDFQNPDGNTVLHFAVVWSREVRRCNEEGVATLLEYGARTDILNNEGDDALDNAKKRGDEVVQAMLLEYRSRHDLEAARKREDRMEMERLLAYRRKQHWSS
jgi:ankyrin repeat protein